MSMNINDLDFVAEEFTVGEVVDILTSNDTAVEQGVVQLYKLQTSDEQQAKHTRHRNKRGFSTRTDKRGSTVAQLIMNGEKLTPEQLSVARMCCLHHRVQLTMIANGQLTVE